MKLTFIFVLVAGIAQAQFSGLSTTDDGSRVYFASALRQRGTDQFLWGKIFSIDASGASLMVQRDKATTIGVGSNNYRLDSPQISGDGRLLLYGGTRDCVGGSSCFLNDQHSVTLRDMITGEETSRQGHGRISRNGRFLAAWVGQTGSTFSLIDLSTSRTVFGTLGAAYAVAADGTAVVNGLQIVKSGVLVTLSDTAVSAATIDDGATTIVYQTSDAKRLFVWDLKKGQTRQLGPNNRDSFQPVLSSDGEWVMYLSTVGTAPQVFISRVDGSDWRQLTSRDDGIKEATLSGDGRVVFAATGNGSLVRVDAVTSMTTELVGMTPTIKDVNATTAGSLTLLHGTGLDNAFIRVAGVSAPILNRSGTMIAFQMPWETPIATGSVSIPEGGAPYFDDAASVQLFAFNARAIELAEPVHGNYVGPIAMHGNFGSLVTDANPALPGETLHVYLIGGGAVSPAVKTGVATPIGRLFPLAAPVQTSGIYGGVTIPLDVPFFGLAPELVGVWQMDFVVPKTWSMRFIHVDIQSLGTMGGGGSVGSIPVNLGVQN